MAYMIHASSSSPCLLSTFNTSLLLPFKCHPFECQIPSSRQCLRQSRPSTRFCAQSHGTSLINIQQLNAQAREERMEHLQKQAMDSLTITINASANPAFPCALIAGDMVLLELLYRLEALQNERVKIIFIDTFHLFPETYTFLQEVEGRYGFRANIFHAAGVADKNQYVEKFGSDFFIRDIEEYDNICKVEPFNRALRLLKVDAIINGRRRDHGAERADLEVFEGGSLMKIQPLAYWEFRDCWDYLKKHGVPYHPLHDEGYPSIGDVHSTLPVPKEKWFEYGKERSGRFQGLKNKDGSVKTECGIHVKVQGS